MSKEVDHAHTLTAIHFGDFFPEGEGITLGEIKSQNVDDQHMSTKVDIFAVKKRLMDNTHVKRIVHPHCAISPKALGRD